jgi:hypothetical protein
MGVHPNISIDSFPKQGEFLNKAVSVCFNYDTSRRIDGMVIRDDAEEPGRLETPRSPPSRPRKRRNACYD